MDCPELALVELKVPGPTATVCHRERWLGSAAEGTCMGSNAKKQTTMAKLNRERRLKERREMKAEKKEARRLAAAEVTEVAPADEPVPD